MTQELSKAGREPGRIQRALIGLFMREARVCEREQLSEHFFSLGLDGAALRDVVWTAGQKIQVSIDSTFAARTYTPIEWDSAKGRTRILAYAHGEGPGSVWARNAGIGEQCHFFGPRASLDVSRMPGGALLFGDETSLGLALALGAQHRDNPPKCIFETHAAAEMLSVLAALGLQDATVIERDAEGRHLQKLIAAIDATYLQGAVILTGHAPSIQHIRRHLKKSGNPMLSILTKPYWAPGKRGLD